jgi:chorismate synthase
MELILETAGESHGPRLTAVLAGIPAGAPVDLARVEAALAARRRGHGRSARQRVEADRVVLSAGVRDGRATGNPIAIEVENRDPLYRDLPPVTTPRPGHADLAGAWNRGLADARDVVERASARETAVRTAAGSIAAQMLEALGVRVLGHVVAVGGVDVGREESEDLEADRAARDASDLHALGGPEAQAAARAAIDAAASDGDTLGGVVRVVCDGCPPGLGGHERPEEKLSARLGAALLGVQAVRAVEIGMGARAASLRGSRVHDAILPREGGGVRRAGNAAGGIEGGTSNGERIVLSAAMKPLATLRRPLPSVDLRTGEPALARVERSDVTAVPALAIVAEAVVALEVARAVRRRFGGASLAEVTEAVARQRARAAGIPPGADGR